MKLSLKTKSTFQEFFITLKSYAVDNQKDVLLEILLDKLAVFGLNYNQPVGLCQSPSNVSQ